jgi:hypothetical protein
MTNNTLSTYIATQDGRNYVFDAFFSINHESTLSITEHPVQTGANISDHAFMEPRTVTFEIGMSDVMQDLSQYISGIESFNNGNSPSRSINAYKVLEKLQQDRIPLTAVTRLGTYNNMLVESLVVPDDKNTTFALKATVTLKEIIVAQVTTVKISSRPQITDSTNMGDQKPQPADESLLAGALLGK